MKKKIWITALEEPTVSTPVYKLSKSLVPYGIEAEGHLYQDNLAQLAWSAPLSCLHSPEVGAWLIAGKAESLAKPTVRQGLSLMALDLQSRRGANFPILLWVTEGALGASPLPTPLGGALCLPAEAKGLEAKIVAQLSIPRPKVSPDYRLALYPLPQLGLWVEVGPADGHAWSGALFGTSGGEITAHGVGPKDRLPERAVLSYPMEGLKIEHQQQAYTAWAVQNPLPADTSYFVRVKGSFSGLVFGSFPESDEPELYVLRLQ